MSYLNRENASFSKEIWERIDQAAVVAAREVLTGRRFLEVDGPYGVGLTAIEVGEEGYCRQPAPDEAGAVLSQANAIPMLRKNFGLSVRRIEGYESMGQTMATEPDFTRARQSAQQALAELDGLSRRRADCDNEQLRSTLAHIGQRKSNHQAWRMLDWLAQHDAGS